MPCYHPVEAYRGRTPNASGKYPLVFKKEQGQPLSKLQIPCGQCIGCRLERSRQWAVRCVHESKMHSENSFITLTYDDQNLPTGHTLVKKDFQDFMKRLRKHLEPKQIRFFHCGEYGDETSRPHYHACIFGHIFQDRKIWTQRDEIKVYTSETLQKIWQKGHTTVGDVTFESAAYVARYVLKKINGPNARSHYEKIDKETGEITDRQPEYTTMSRRPGIGSTFFEKYRSDIYPSDQVITRGFPTKPPKYYDYKYEIINPTQIEEVKAERKRKALTHKSDQTPKRLADRENCIKAKVKQLKRQL